MTSRRRVGATLRSHGISNTLRANGFERSVRVSPKDRKDQRMTSGFALAQMSFEEVRVRYYLGHRHGVYKPAERIKIVDEFLDQYTEILSDCFAVSKVDAGTEDAFLVIKEQPDPKVIETLRKAAEKLAETAGMGKAADELNRWACLASLGLDW